LSAKLVPTFAHRGPRVVSVTDSYGRILGFLDRQLSSVGTRIINQFNVEGFITAPAHSLNHSLAIVSCSSQEFVIRLYRGPEGPSNVSPMSPLQQPSSQSLSHWYEPTLKLNSVALFLERSIPTERPPLAGELSTNFPPIVCVTWSE
jgi:hypothetical protein